VTELTELDIDALDQVAGDIRGTAALAAGSIAAISPGTRVTDSRRKTRSSAATRATVDPRFR
jgi:hypothetical protein